MAGQAPLLMEDKTKEHMEKGTNVPEPTFAEQKAKIPYNIVSYFYKSLRIGDVETAMKCGAIIRREAGERYVAHTLLKLLGEDCTPEEWQRLYPTLSEYQRNSEQKNAGWFQGHHDMWHAIFAIAKAKKWYQTPEGIELEELRQKYHEDADIEIANSELPSWIFDFHTYEGKRRISAGTADLRLDGRWENRFNIMRRWQEITSKIDKYEEMVKVWVKSHYKKEAK